MSLTFPLTAARIEECRKLLDLLGAIQEPAAQRAQINAIINGIRSIWDTLGSEGSHVDGFRHWKDAEWKKITADPLLQFIDGARKQYFHMGDPVVRSATHVASLHLVPDENRAQLELTPEGLYSIKPDLSGVPDRTYTMLAGVTSQTALGSPPAGASNVRITGGKIHISPGATVNIENADVVYHGQNPKALTHLGRTISGDPVEVCELALSYMGALLETARSKFGG